MKMVLMHANFCTCFDVHCLTTTHGVGSGVGHGRAQVRAVTTAVSHVPDSVASAKHFSPMISSGTAELHDTSSPTLIVQPADVTLMIEHANLTTHGVGVGSMMIILPCDTEPCAPVV